MEIRDRILARRDLDQARLDRDIDALAAGLNAECVPTMIPAYINAYAILGMAPHAEVIMGLLEMAAAGTPVQALAQQLLSMEGAQVMEPGYEPAYVDRMQVNDAMFNPDGSEK